MPEKISISLTVYDWHKLLNVINFSRSIANRDAEDATDLWEKITTQLDDKEHVCYGSDKHRALNPELFVTKPETKETQILTEESRDKLPWYKKVWRKTNV